MLGEADHGDGRAVEFRVALTMALIERCHYDAVFFEAAHYDFAEVSRRLRLRQRVSADMLAAAIGGLWRSDAELAPLIPFLLAEARSGRVRLGGLDDQAGSIGAFYEPDQMPAALAAALPEPRGTECGALLVRRTHWANGSHAEPERSRALACLAEIGAAIRGRHDADGATRDAQLGMIASLERLYARDPLVARTPPDMNAYSQARDRSMYLNFRMLADRLPAGSRIIVWAANSHIAKDAAADGQYAGGRNFGAFIHEAYGRRAFALGFTAYGGAHYWTRQEPSRPLTEAAPGSLEAQAMSATRPATAYLGPNRLAAMAPMPGGLFLHQPATARWSDVMDGIIVFREERPPRRVD